MAITISVQLIDKQGVIFRVEGQLDRPAGEVYKELQAKIAELEAEGLTAVKEPQIQANGNGSLPLSAVHWAGEQGAQTRVFERIKKETGWSAAEAATQIGFKPFEWRGDEQSYGDRAIELFKKSKENGKAQPEEEDGLGAIFGPEIDEEKPAPNGKEEKPVGAMEYYARAKALEVEMGQAREILSKAEGDCGEAMKRLDSIVASELAISLEDMMEKTESKWPKGKKSMPFKDNRHEIRLAEGNGSATDPETLLKIARLGRQPLGIKAGAKKPDGSWSIVEDSTARLDVVNAFMKAAYPMEPTEADEAEEAYWEALYELQTEADDPEDLFLKAEAALEAAREKHGDPLPKEQWDGLRERLAAFVEKETT